VEQIFPAFLPSIHLDRGKESFACGIQPGPKFRRMAIAAGWICIFFFTSGGIFFIILGKLAIGDQAAEAGMGSGARYQGVERDEQVATHRSSGQSGEHYLKKGGNGGQRRF
jgi:hypothetical protein